MKLLFIDIFDYQNFSFFPIILPHNFILSKEHLNIYSILNRRMHLNRGLLSRNEEQARTMHRRTIVLPQWRKHASFWNFRAVRTLAGLSILVKIYRRVKSSGIWGVKTSRRANEIDEFAVGKISALETICHALISSTDKSLRHIDALSLICTLTEWSVGTSFDAMPSQWNQLNGVRRWVGKFGEILLPLVYDKIKCEERKIIARRVLQPFRAIKTRKIILHRHLEI